MHKYEEEDMLTMKDLCVSKMEKLWVKGKESTEEEKEKNARLKDLESQVATLHEQIKRMKEEKTLQEKDPKKDKKTKKSKK